MRDHHGRGHGHHKRHGRGHGGLFEERLGRLLGHGDLRYVILSLLEEKPRHGYELIKALEELSSGVYSPSPGTIYPTLSYLEDGGFAEANAEDKKKLYSITESGKEMLNENREFVKEILKRFAMAGEKVSKLRHLMGRDEAEEIARDERSPIRKSMHLLKAELFHFVDAKKELKLKVAEIIEKAAEDIRKLKEE